VVIRDRHGGGRMGKCLVALAEKFDLAIFGWYGRYVGGWEKAQGLTLSEGLALMEEEAFPLAVRTSL
jgi:hypothetical protein